MPGAENYQSQKQQINGVAVTVTTYKIGETFHCHIENVDPGATIARASGQTLAEALEIATQKAGSRLANS